MKRVLFALVSLAISFPALGQEEEGIIPYDDSEQPRSKPAPRSRKRPRKAPRPLPEPTFEEQESPPPTQAIELDEYSDAPAPRDERVDENGAVGQVQATRGSEIEWRSREDDPNTGLAGEVIAGVFLLEAARGSGVDPRASGGARFTWEFGRLTGDENLSEALFADVRWSWVATAEGTRQVRADTHYHFMTLAPAYAWPLGRGSDFAFYAQAGGGAAYQLASIQDGESQTVIGGMKPVLQYGVGFRGRPKLAADGNLRIAFRFEATRFRRAYMDDTFLGGSIGAAF